MTKLSDKPREMDLLHVCLEEITQPLSPLNHLEAKVEPSWSDLDRLEKVAI